MGSTTRQSFYNFMNRLEIFSFLHSTQTILKPPSLTVRRYREQFFFYRCTVHSDVCTVHSPTNALLLIYINIAPTRFGLQPSSGSLHWTWLKLYLCQNIRWNYVVIYYAVVWQHSATQPHNTGLFISPSGISELDCATIKTDTAERSISIGRESLQVFFFCTRGLGVLPGSTARG